jgi:hypothetical protein
MGMDGVNKATHKHANYLAKATRIANNARKEWADIDKGVKEEEQKINELYEKAGQFKFSDRSAVDSAPKVAEKVTKDPAK